MGITSFTHTQAKILPTHKFENLLEMHKLNRTTSASIQKFTMWLAHVHTWLVCKATCEFKSGFLLTERQSDTKEPRAKTSSVDDNFLILMQSSSQLPCTNTLTFFLCSLAYKDLYMDIGGHSRILHISNYSVDRFSYDCFV